ncbi:MAG: nitroreductase family protein [Oligoflexia bacterium]|nr:nitroreductase family protein [Oligoflexia bacterium]
MDFFETVKRRRSVRRYTQEPVPSTVIETALDAALLAPNSSNLQTWEFYWVQSPDKKAALVKSCLNQGAARTAQELIVVVSNPNLYKKTAPELLKRLNSPNAPKEIGFYYGKLVPVLYGWTILAPVKWLIFNLVGLFRPIMRRPWSSRDIDEVCIKSAALASENFMLAVAAQGYDSCPMEGFDECRVKRILRLGYRHRVVMVISVGRRDPKGIWGEQLRFSKDWFVKRI